MIAVVTARENADVPPTRSSIALANFLRNQLEGRGWTQQDLVDETGLARATVSRLINGQIAEPDLSTLHRLADVFEMRMSRLLEICGYPVGDATPPSQQAQRLAALVESLPWLGPVTEDIATLTPDEREGLLVYLETLKRRRTK